MTDDARDWPPRGALIAALTLAIAAIAALLVVVATREAEPSAQPVAIAAAPAPKADSAACRALMDKLPDALGDYHRAQAIAPQPASTAAWQSEPGSDLVVLRCGIARPDDFVASSPLQAVDEVSWFRVGGDGLTTWIAVDRPVYIALTLPDGTGPTPIQLISRAVAQAMKSTPLDPAPIG